MAGQVCAFKRWFSEVLGYWLISRHAMTQASQPVQRVRSVRMADFMMFSYGWDWQPPSSFFNFWGFQFSPVVVVFTKQSALCAA